MSENTQTANSLTPPHCIQKKYFQSEVREGPTNEDSVGGASGLFREVNNEAGETSVKRRYENEIQIKDSTITVANMHQDRLGGLPTIPVEIGKQTFDFLIDSGSSITIIDPHTFSEIKGNEKTNIIARKVRVTTLNNSEIYFHGCAEITIKIGQTKCKQTFFIARDALGRNYQGILGYDFFTKFKTEINMDKGYFKLATERVPLKNSNSSTQNNIEIVSTRLVTKQNIQPGQSVLVKLKYEPISMEETILFTPEVTKQNISILPTVANPKEGQFYALIKNCNENTTLHLNKHMKLGSIRRDFEYMPEQNFISEEINLIKARPEILELRNKEFNILDFKLEHIEQRQRIVLEKLLQNYKTVFSKNLLTLGKTDAVKPALEISNDLPKSTLPYSIPFALHKKTKELLQDLIDGDIIERSDSLWAAPMILIKKKSINDGQETKYRLAIDARLINDVTIPQPSYTPKIRDIVARLSGKKFYSVVDFKMAYHQIVLPEEIRKYFAFISIFGHFQYKRMIFGAKNSTATFMQLMNKVFDNAGDNVHFYLDDLIVTADNFEEMIATLRNVFERLSEFNLTLAPDKCQFMLQEVNYLGYKVCKEGISPIEDNLKKIDLFPKPKSLKQTKKFVGLAGFYRSSIKNFAQLIAPLEEICTQNKKFKWNDRAEESFQEIKLQFNSRPFLIQPELNQKFYLQTDASKNQIGAALLQKREGTLKPCFYFSKKLSRAESKYSATKLEAFAIISSVRHFREFLFGKRFKIISDHRSLIYNLKVRENPASQIIRWLMELSEYSFDLEYIKGEDNVLADYLSRAECNWEEGNSRIDVNALEQREYLTNGWLRDEQLKDNDIIVIRKKILEGKENLKKRNGDTFFIDTNTDLVAQIRVRFKGGKEIVLTNILVPRVLQKHAIHQSHIAHSGIAKTYQDLRQFYTWDGIYDDVTNFVKSCTICNQVKNSHQKRQPVGKTLLPDAPGQILHADFVYFNEANKYGLTIIDAFSRFLKIYITSNMKAHTVAEKFIDYFANFSKPRTIITDQAKNFTSEIFEEMCGILGINLRHSLAYSPFQNGKIERIHSNLKNTIQALKKSGSDLQLAVNLHTDFYNNSVHRVTGYKPSLLHFGRDTNQIFNFAQIDKPKEVPVEYPVYLHRLREELMEIWKTARDNSDSFANKQSLTLQTKNKGEQLSAGSCVFVRVSDKFKKEKFEGPFLIKKLVSNTTALIENTSKTCEWKISISKLKMTPERKTHLM